MPPCERRFKRVNESFGPKAREEVLKTVGQRLRACLRSAELKRSSASPHAGEGIARLGGDEFTVLLGNIGSPRQAGLVAQRIVRALDEPIVVGEHALTVGAGIRIRIRIRTPPDDGHDTGTLLKSASLAMHAARRELRHRIRFYGNAMSAAISHKVKIETELRRALHQGELQVCYRPQVDLRAPRAVGAEA